MKITFVQLPLPIQLENNNFTFPLGPLILASFVKKAGHAPQIIDLDRLFKKTLKFKNHFLHHAARHIVNAGADIFGFYIMCNEQLPFSILLAKKCKTLKPSSKIIFGGPDVSFEEIPLLKAFKHIDIIVRGEGELTLTDLLYTIQIKGDLRRVKGITFREINQIIRNPDRSLIRDLDSLPLPDFALLPCHQEYKESMIEGGRGCPFSCSFCATCKMWGHKSRIKSPQRIKSELSLIKKHQNIDPDIGVHIVHDHLLVNRIKSAKLLYQLRDLNIPWNCAARLDSLNNKLIKLLAEAGCKAIESGIESGSLRILKSIGKNFNLKKLPRIIAALIKHDIHPTFTFILGLPGEGKRDLNQTLLIALRCKLHEIPPAIFLTPFSIMKGSNLFKNIILHTNSICLNKNLRCYSRDPKEWNLIKKYPALFPAFYRLKPKALNPLDISKFYQYLVQFFPMTTLLLLNYMKISPFKLYKKLSLISKNPGRSLKLLLKQTGSNPIIKNIARHEFTFKNIVSDNNASSTFNKRLAVSYRPRISQTVILESFDYDMSLAMKSLRNQKFIFTKRKAIFAYIPGNTPKVLSLDPGAIKLLSLCNGKHNIRQIIDIIRNEYSALEHKNNIRITVMDRLNSFLKNGLIEIKYV
jgi:radical SAM superfamily enzyme YgiQ (UPF0313 family)